MSSKETLKDKLATEVESCDWSMLSIHQKREAIILIDGSIELLDAGVALATDDAESVKIWQKDDLIRRPTESEISQWEKDPHNKFAKFLIIQPFVLIQLIH